MAGVKKKGIHEEWLTPEGLVKIEGWAKDGLIDEQIAANMNVARSTLAKWKNKYTDIGDALKKGKEIVDRHVENALYKNATGDWVEETDTAITIDADGTKKQTVTKKRRYIAPSTTAQIYWLKNRKPGDWSDRREMTITADVDIGKRATDIEKYLTADGN